VSFGVPLGKTVEVVDQFFIAYRWRFCYHLIVSMCHLY
jgi:hypothetical protein